VQPTFFMSVRLLEKERSELVNFVLKTREKFNPVLPPNHFFLDDKIAENYVAEKRIATIFTFFTLLTIFIACLGMLGLSAFMTEQRTKEIGVRKVMGGSEKTILTMFSLEFAKLVAIANVVAIPFVYYFMNRWLQDFIYRWIQSLTTSFAMWFLIFITATVVTLIFALLTVLWQVLKATRTNPGVTLQYE